MAETMLAATANSTSPHFGLNHMCRKHNVLFTMEHVEGCDGLQQHQELRQETQGAKHQGLGGERKEAGHR